MALRREGGLAEEFVVDAFAVAVCHAGDVGADDAVGGTFGGLIPVGRGQAGWVRFVVGEQFGDHADGALTLLEKLVRVVDLAVKKALQFAARGGGSLREADQPVRVLANLFNRRDPSCLDRGGGSVEKAGDQEVDYLAERFEKLDPFLGAGELHLDGFPDIGERGDGFPDFVDGEELGGVGVVEVGGVVGDFVGKVDDLRFERRPLLGQITVEFRGFAGGEVAGVFDDAFADFESEIEAGEAGVAGFEAFDDAEAVEIMIEGFAEALHLAAQFVFAGMGEGRVADVVDEGEGFGEVFVEAEGGGDGAGDLRNLHRMGEAVAEMIGDAGREDLRLVFETAEGAGVDDAIAVALELGAVGVGQFRVAPPAAHLRPKPEGGERFVGAGRGHYFSLASP